MSIEIKGLDELNKKLAQLGKIAKEAMESEMADVALNLAGKASEMAPILNGDLRGELANPQKDGDGWKVGAGLVYTRYQHEGVSFNHPKGGSSKFIEKPFKSNRDKYIQQIGNEIESRLK